MNLTVSTPPTDEPITVDQQQSWSRVTNEAEGQDIERMIKQAREMAEFFTGRALMTQTIIERRDCFPHCFEFGRTPVQNVTSLQYIDVNGTTQTIGTGNYYTDLVSEPPRLVPVPTYSWPLTQDGRPNAVILTYVAGYASAEVIPMTILNALSMIVDHLYENRGNEDASAGGLPVMPEIAKNALWPYRIW